MTPTDHAAARNAHRAQAIEARIAATVASLPEGCKVCRRCRGARRLDAWAATGSVCARCHGRGYDLTPAMARAAKIERLTAHLAEVATDGKVATEALAAKLATGRRFGVATLTDRVARYRADWNATRAALRALEAR